MRDPSYMLATIRVETMSIESFSITTDNPHEAAQWLLRTLLLINAFSNINPVNPLRQIHFYCNTQGRGEWEAFNERWRTALSVVV